MSKRKIALYIVLYIGIVLILAGTVLAFILKFTNGGTDEFKFFYVTDEQGSIYATNDTAELSARQETKFEVGYTLSKNKGYSVKVVPNVTDDTKFTYKIDGEAYDWSDKLDMTAAFNVKQHDDYFTVTMPDSMLAALKTVYVSTGTVQESVTLPGNVSIVEQPYFKLVVASYNGSAEIKILLRLKCPVTNIGTGDELSGIVFY